MDLLGACHNGEGVPPMLLRNPHFLTKGLVYDNKANSTALNQPPRQPFLTLLSFIRQQ